MKVLLEIPVKKTSPTITIKAKPSVGHSGYAYKWFITTFVNYCPLCHHYNTLTINPKGVYETNSHVLIVMQIMMVLLEEINLKSKSIFNYSYSTNFSLKKVYIYYIILFNLLKKLKNFKPPIKIFQTIFLNLFFNFFI